MYELIDFKYEDIYTPYCIDVESWYRVRNIETNEEKWIDGYTYSKYRRLGLITK